MEHRFTVEHATAYSVDEAILIEYFRHWIGANREAGRHLFDGRTWTYASLEEIAKNYPYWTPRVIDRIVRRLVENGVLLREFDKDKTTPNRVSWYAFLSEASFLEPISPNGEMGLSPNGEMDRKTPHDYAPAISPTRKMPSHQTVKCISPNGEMLNKDAVSSPLLADPTDQPPQGGSKPKTRKRREGVNPETETVYADFLEFRGGKDTIPAGNRKWAKWMLEQEFNADQIARCLRWLSGDPWYERSAREVTLNHVAERIGKWVRMGEPERWGANGHTGSSGSVGEAPGGRGDAGRANGASPGGAGGSEAGTYKRSWLRADEEPPIVPGRGRERFQHLGSLGKPATADVPGLRPGDPEAPKAGVR